MRSKRTKLAVLLLVLGLFAAACADDDDDAEPGAAETAAEDPVAEDTGTPEPAEGTEPAETGTDEDVAAGGGDGVWSHYIGEPQNPLIPTNTNETEGSAVINTLFSGLIAYDVENSDPVNVMAESIESDDQQSWTITIQEGWTFHDGTPVTAQSYVDGWNYGAYGPNAQANSYFFENIEGYEEVQCPAPAEGETEAPECTPEAFEGPTEMSGLTVVDDTTFEVTLVEPFSQFPLTLGYNPFFPVPEALFEDPEAYGEAPIGNGPFMMDGVWEHNRGINVVRYEEYGGEPARSGGVEFRIYDSINTAYNDLLGGNLDFMEQVPPENIATAQADFGDRYIERESSSFTYLGFPTYLPPFDNSELRIAMSKAIDREAITEAIFNGARTPARSVVSPVVAGGRPDPCGENCAFDPEAAREQFEAAGGLPEQPLTIWFNSGAGHEEWVAAAANQWAQNLGIEPPVFEQYDFSEYLDFIDNQELTGPFRLGWVMDYPSPQNYLQPLYSTTGSSNSSGYSNPEVDDLISQGNAAPTLEEGIDFYHQAEDIILADMPVIPMFYGLVQGAYSERLSNVAIDAFTFVDAANVEVAE